MRQPTKKVHLSEIWGRALADRRNLLSLSQAELASLNEVTQQTISKIEAGLMIPHDNLKLSLANTLGIDPGELFAWPDRAELLDGAA